MWWLSITDSARRRDSWREVIHVFTAVRVLPEWRTENGYFRRFAYFSKQILVALSVRQ